MLQNIADMQLARQLFRPSFRSGALLPPLDSESHDSYSLDLKLFIIVITLVLLIFGRLLHCIYKPIFTLTSYIDNRNVSSAPHVYRKHSSIEMFARRRPYICNYANNVLVQADPGMLIGTSFFPENQISLR